MASFEWNFSVPLGRGGEGEKNKAFFQCRVNGLLEKGIWATQQSDSFPASEKREKKLSTVAKPTTTGSIYISIIGRGTVSPSQGVQFHRIKGVQFHR